MSKTFHQHKLIFFFGCIVVPFVLFGALFYYRANNVTELLMNVGTGAYITTFILLVWLVYLLYQEGKNILKPIELIILVVLISIPLLLPYTHEAAINTNLHIILSYAALIYMNTLFFKLHYTNTKYRNIYSIVCMFCFFHCLLSMRITGLAEIVYASTVSILLTLLYGKE